MIGVCDVCAIVRHDSTPKEVQHCNLCDADLCDFCRSRLTIRAVAAIKRGVQRALGAGA